MARINRISITLCALLFTTLPLTPMAHASKQAGESSATTHITKKADKKKSTATTQKTQKASQKTAKKAASKSTTKSKTASSVKNLPLPLLKTPKLAANTPSIKRPQPALPKSVPNVRAINRIV